MCSERTKVAAFPPGTHTQSRGVPQVGAQVTTGAVGPLFTRQRHQEQQQEQQQQLQLLRQQQQHPLHQQGQQQQSLANTAHGVSSCYKRSLLRLEGATMSKSMAGEPACKHGLSLVNARAA